MKGKIIRLVAIIALAASLALPVSAPAGASSAKGKPVNTVVGPLVIDKVRITHKVQGVKAEPGFKLLVVEAKKKGNKKIGSKDVDKFMDITGVSVDGSDDVQVAASMVGYSIGGNRKSNKLFVAFSVAEEAHQFKLNWPGNPTIDLGK